MALYRTYRPKQFKEVIGRDDIKRILAQQLNTNTLTHAYLFSGTRGTGKTTIARLLAKAANCTHRDKETAEPCNECASCSAINKGASPDLVEIDAASNRRIEEVRELRELVRYAPASSLYKIYIIDEVHMLTKEAFNALLKTLEEPPKHAIFILATTELEKIPETIFSRCQHFSFGRVAIAEIKERLLILAKAEGVVVEEEVLKDIARRSTGSLRDAESLLGQVLSIGKKEITQEDANLFLPKVPFSETIAFLSSVILKDATQSFAILEKLEQGGINPTFFLANCLEYMRQLVLYSASQDAKRLSFYFSDDEIQEIQELAKQSNPKQLREITVELLKASQELKLSPDFPMLPLELSVVLLCDDTSPSRPSLQQAGEQRDLSSPEVKKGLPKTETIKPPAIAVAVPASNPDPEQAPTTSAPSTESSHSLEEILDGWGEVMAKARDKNHALNFMLGVAEPISITGNTLELAFKYRLQQEKVLEFKNREVVETIIKEVYGTGYRIQPIIKEDLEQKKNAKPTQEDNLVKAALEVFEGAEILS